METRTNASQEDRTENSGTLATEIHLLEEAYVQGRRLDVNDALAQLIRDRYDFNGDADATGRS